jgi:hypothetical protein
MIMVIHTFGDYARFHPHLHAIVADGLFRADGTFYCLPKTDLKQLEEIFRSKVLTMLKTERRAYRKTHGLASDTDVGRQTSEVRGRKKDETGCKVLHAFRFPTSDLRPLFMTHGGNKKNFEVFSAEEFIAAITQHIPDKSFQMVRYYGWYSSRTRGERIKAGLFRPGDEPGASAACAEVTVLDVSEHRPRRVPSKTWRELIKKACAREGG